MMRLRPHRMPKPGPFIVYNGTSRIVTATVGFLLLAGVPCLAFAPSTRSARAITSCNHYRQYVSLATDQDTNNAVDDETGREREKVDIFSPSMDSPVSIEPEANGQSVSSTSASVLLASSLTPSLDLETSYVLSKDNVKPLIRIGSGDKEKIINCFGLWAIGVSLVTGPVWMAAMLFVERVLYKLLPSFDPHRSLFDATGKLWAKTWLTMTQSYPTVSGNVDLLKANSSMDSKPCLFVANHASWLDIPVLCTVLEPVFKFIAKGELQNVPCVGQQLKGGNHILIDRTDRRSQLRTFKEGLQWLKKERVPLMAFPEGQRSVDGRLLPFKGGVLQLARKANVPIVPISISHTHAVMPSNSYFPVQPGNNKLHVHIHDAIENVGDMSEDQVEELVRAMMLSKMPLDQHPFQE